MIEKQIEIAAKLYDARRTLRRLIGDSYAEKVAPFMRVVALKGRDMALRHGMDVAKDMAAKGIGEGIVWIFAAIVEVIEPDELTPAI